MAGPFNAGEICAQNTVHVHHDVIMQMLPCKKWGLAMAWSGVIHSCFLPQRVNSTSHRMSHVARHEASPTCSSDMKKVNLGAFHGTRQQGKTWCQRPCFKLISREFITAVECPVKSDRVTSILPKQAIKLEVETLRQCHGVLGDGLLGW